MVLTDETRHLPGFVAGWKTLEEITPFVIALNAESAWSSSERRQALDLEGEAEK